MASSPFSSIPPAATRRRELTRQYKDNPPPMGVYVVRCAAERWVYVRSSTNLPGAFNRERFQLRLGKHPDKRLQQAWNTHGEAALCLEVLGTVKPRPDASDADYRAELTELLALWQEELAA